MGRAPRVIPDLLSLSRLMGLSNGARLSPRRGAAWKLVSIRSWRLPRWQIAQILFGFAIPFLLVPHVLGTRITAAVFGITTGYPFVLARIWPGAIADQTVLLLLVWAHGCIGLHFWLRLTPAYERRKHFLLCAAVLLPAAALAGVMMQARALIGDLTGAADFEAIRSQLRGPGPDAVASLVDWRDLTRWGFYVPLLVLVLALWMVPWWRRRSGGVTVAYVEGPTPRASSGMTLLEISRGFGVPHVSICGGRARCSTCRVRCSPIPCPWPRRTRRRRAPCGRSERQRIRVLPASGGPAARFSSCGWCNPSPARRPPPSAPPRIREWMATPPCCSWIFAASRP
jgi:adenylate cyclase